MTKKQLHLVRHGEVDNPEGILYGRLAGYGLSVRGHDMAKVASDALVARKRDVAALYASPLLRARQSAQPIAEAFGLDILNEPRIIEPTNHFEGEKNHGPDSAFKNPCHWWRFWNPLLPSWGEPYRRIQRRVRAAMDDAWEIHDDGDIVMVCHQAPIWNAVLSAAGKPLAHNPAKRRCGLSSITSFEKVGDSWREVGYESPAETSDAKDVGAV